jgi:hypothetical protein
MTLSLNFSSPYFTTAGDGFQHEEGAEGGLDVRNFVIFPSAAAGKSEGFPFAASCGIISPLQVPGWRNPGE